MPYHTRNVWEEIIDDKAPFSQTTRRRNGAGYSIPAAAAVLDVPYKTLRGAIVRGQAKTIQFGAQERMTQREVDRLRELFSGESAPPPVAAA